MVKEVSSYFLNHDNKIKFEYDFSKSFFKPINQKIQNLKETEKQQVHTVLDDKEIPFTMNKQEILRRESEYKSDRMKTFTLDEVEASFNFVIC